MPVEIARKHEIQCGHRISGHEGKYRNLHGHAYVFYLTPLAVTGRAGKARDAASGRSTLHRRDMRALIVPLQWPTRGWMAVHAAQPSMPDVFAVNELFQSIQGEARHAGTPSVFVRLQGCAVSYPRCDVVGRRRKGHRTSDRPRRAKLAA